jgi:hypothetical protein
MLSQEYGDCSSPMGACGGVRCLNAAQNWQLGWSKPLATLNGANFNPGASSSQTFTVPALTTSDTNFVMVVPSAWKGMGGAPMFVSYRVPVGSDAGLLSQYRVSSTG